MQDAKKYQPAVVYAALALLVMLPLLKSGYILTLDMVFTPTITLPSATMPSYPFWLVLKLLSIAIPVQVLQKVLLFGVLFVAGLGMHVLVKRLAGKQGRKAEVVAPYVAGVTYMFNPFVYERFMAGQYAVLLGYALLPFLLVLAARFRELPSYTRALALGGYLVLIAVVSIHTFGLALLALALAVPLHALGQPRGMWRAYSKPVLALGAVLLAGTLYWLVPAALGQGETSHIVSGFGQGDQTAFATYGGKVGVLGSVLALQGFWGEGKNVLLLPQDMYAWWWVPIALLWVLVAVGIAVGWRQRRRLSVYFVLLAVVVVVLAVGPEGTVFAPLNRWLYVHIPFFAGYREPQKFVALLALSYAYFAGTGAQALYERFVPKKAPLEYARGVLVLLCAIPVLCAPLMPLGFHGQLRAVQYPVEWEALRDRLQATCTGNCKVLFLPWHLYMRYDFAGRIIASPAAKYFGPHIVTSSNPELGKATPYKLTSTQKALQNTILPAAAQGGKGLAAGLQRQHIQYIVLAKSYDYKKYQYLDNQSDIEKSLDTPSVVLYTVKGGSR